MAAPWVEGASGMSRKAVTVVGVGSRMEPGVTVWGRAGGFWALPRSCIYRCQSSSLLKNGALDSWGGSRRDAGLFGASLSADVPLAIRLEHMIVFVKGNLEVRTGSGSSATDQAHGRSRYEW